MDWLDVLIWPEVLIGVLLGLLAAGLVHWLAPPPEPLMVEPDWLPWASSSASL